MKNNLTLKDFEDNGYFADQELVDIVNASLYLKKPILIEGPAGTGKTYLAKTLSRNSVSSVEDLAELSVSELIEIEPSIDESEGAKLIMKAREPWFEETA